MVEMRGPSGSSTRAAGATGRGATVPGAQGPRRARGKEREDPRSALALELHAVRQMFDESAARFTGRISAELERLATVVEREPGPGKRATADMLAIVRGLRLKPHKGRLKDLSRVEAALEALVASCDGAG